MIIITFKRLLHEGIVIHIWGNQGTSNGMRALNIMLILAKDMNTGIIAVNNLILTPLLFITIESR